MADDASSQNTETAAADTTTSEDDTTEDTGDSAQIATPVEESAQENDAAEDEATAKE